VSRRVRVALLAGTLAPGGAERQLVCAALALSAAGVEVRVFSLTRGERYERVLRELGLEPVWVGRRGSPIARLGTLALGLSRFRPDVIQSTHSFANLYAGILGRALGIASVGVLRSSLAHCAASNGGWTRPLLCACDALLVNSPGALEEVTRRGWLPAGRLFLVPNAVDLAVWDAAAGSGSAREGDGRVRAAIVGRLAPVKRVDRYLRALALASSREPTLDGWVIGDGKERASLQMLAARLSLSPERVRFEGHRDDIPELLAQAHMLVLSSDDEGSPNTVLEAMAARLPVIATPAGDAARLVHEGKNGHLVDPDDPEAMARRLVDLARSPERRRRMGEEGRRIVARDHDGRELAGRLLAMYSTIARRRRDRRLFGTLSGAPGHGRRTA
jgi:glycosyltransferase involved in cell wall biosynthesis